MALQPGVRISLYALSDSQFNHPPQTSQRGGYLAFRICNTLFNIERAHKYKRHFYDVWRHRNLDAPP